MSTDGLLNPSHNDDVTRNLSSPLLGESNLRSHQWESMEAPREDEAVRDLRKELTKHYNRQLTRNHSDPMPSVLANDLHARDVGIPGGFRRHFLSSSSIASSSPKSTKGAPTKFAHDSLLEFLLQVSDKVQEINIQISHGHRCAAPLPKATGTSETNDMNKQLQGVGGTSDSKDPRAARLGRSSDTATVLVILKSFVGGTMLVLPSEIYQSGLVCGNIAFWSIGLLELWCMVKLLEAHRMKGSSFGQLAGEAMGSLGSTAVETSIVLSQIGFASAEMIYVSKNGAFVFKWLQVHSPFFAMLFSGVSPADVASMLVWLQLGFAVPVAWYKDLSALTFFNVIGNLLVAIGLLILLFTLGQGLATNGLADDIKMDCSLQQIFVFLGFSVFTFEGINMVIPMYTAHKNKDSYVRCLTCTLVAIIAIMSAFASANAMLYGSHLKPILTMNLPEASTSQVIVPLVISLASMILVPLMTFPTYEILEASIQRFFGVVMETDTQKHVFRAILMVLCAVVARFGGAHLDYFLALVGAVGCVPLALVYPSIIHLQLVATSLPAKVVDGIVAIIGLGITLFCSSSVL